jgi:hypothetical protein
MNKKRSEYEINVLQSLSTVKVVGLDIFGRVSSFNEAINARVAGNASVFGDARVSGDARVFDD